MDNGIVRKSILEAAGLSFEYIVKQPDSPADAVISQDEGEVGRLHVERKGIFKLLGNENQSWALFNHIDGAIRPFSIIVFFVNDKYSSENRSSKEYVLKIKDNLFHHNGKFYSFGGIPEGRLPKDHLMGSKIICRLVNFPFSTLEDVDLETKHHLRRYRGIYVGEFFGIGSTGFHVKLEEELADIGLPLTASTYLLYSTR
jgi:hypothetical protein